MKTIALTLLILFAVGCKGGDQNGATAGATPPDGSTQPSATSTGDASAGSLTEKDFPVPFYPNSKEDDQANPSTYSHDLPGGHRSISSSRITADSMQQVEDFYKGKMKIDSATLSGDSGYVAGNVENGDTVEIILKKDPRGTAIGLAADVKK